MNNAEYKLTSFPKDTISRISILNDLMVVSSWDGVTIYINP
jgi:hypothetical protein